MAFVPGSGSTAFGIFDNDVDFQNDADKIVDWTRRKLGDPVMHVELSSSHIYRSFEEACLEYSAIVNQYQAKSVLTTFLGSSVSSLSGSEQKYPNKLLEFQKKMAEPFGEEAGLNGPHALLSASIELKGGVQKYDLNSALSSSLSGSRAFIKEIFHFSPMSAYRFFGTTSAVNYLHNQFSFESFTPETIFYLLPIWEDVLRGMQFKMSNKIRRSNYSYALHNNELTLYPTPQSDMTLHFTYARSKDPVNPDTNDPSLDGVANLANIPFGNIMYSNLNSLSKHWIRKFSFALAKETLGQIRGKMTTIPIPNGDLTLNGPELISDARAEQDMLRQELKDLLEDTTYDKLIAKEAEMSQMINESIKNIPLMIYIG
jgi:hypothetical protein